MNESSTSGPGVLLVSADLFFGSRVRSSVEAAGHTLDVAVAGPIAAEKLTAGTYRLVVIDLETPRLAIGDLLSQRNEALRPVFVAYAPHVKSVLLNVAREAGCDAVLTRGQFDSQLKDLPSKYLGRGT
ncbi:MAG: hypothetical protein KF861_04645 [Planctomycetaceae bacterium]|nr:hypothetical protein [Planctomycetaceae bacterium]